MQPGYFPRVSYNACCTRGSPGKRRLNVRTAYWLIICGVVLACVAVRQADPGFMARLRLLGFDILQQTLPRTPDASYPVRIVDIDERSIKAFGNWPWRRDLLAQLIDSLFASGVRVVVFDMVFPDATPGRSTTCHNRCAIPRAQAHF